MENIFSVLYSFFKSMGFSKLFYLSTKVGTFMVPGELIMICIACFLLYLAIHKEYEPYLLIPIAFGMLLVNLPFNGLMEHPSDGVVGGLLYYLYQGIDLGIYPPLIFLCIGAGTDFGPLIANPKSLLLGAAAQFGIFFTFIGVLTTKKERTIKMEQLREVSQTEKIIFPIIVVIFTVLLLPSASALIGMLMLGNLLKESKRVPLLVDAITNSLMYIVSILLGLTVGAKATANQFLNIDTIKIIALGLIAFSIGTAAGVLIGKLMCFLSKGKVNPLIGAAGVSAVPMAARVVQKEGQKYNPSNFLLMHAMGPNVAGVIGSAIAAGMLLLFFK